MPRRKASAHRPLPTDIATALAAAVRAAREDAAMTQEAVAARAGVSVQMVRRLEAGTANPTLGTLYAVAGALDAELHSLLNTNT